MKTLGYTQIKFKKNNGKWHDLIGSELFYEEPHETKEKSFKYEEFIHTDSEVRNEFYETKDSLLPWGKEMFTLGRLVGKRIRMDISR